MLILKKVDFLKKVSNDQKLKYSYELVPDEFSTKNLRKIKIFCKVCNIVFEQNYSSHQKGHGCKQCQYKQLAKHNTYTFGEFVNKAKKVHGDMYEYVDSNYINSLTKIGILCLQCNSLFYQIPGNHLSGHGCPNDRCVNTKISKKNRISFDNYLLESVKIFGDVFLYVNYLGKHSDVDIECLKCGYQFQRKGRDHLGSLGCPNCFTDKSHGERKIREYLENNNIQFEREKTFSDLRGKSKYSILRYDFYLPQQNIIIEFDGIHHFEYYPFSKKLDLSECEKQQKLKHRQDNDKLKDDYCSKKNIKLIRIKYNESIERKLDYEFKQS